MDATAVSASMRALARVPTDHFDRMVAALDAIPLDVAVSGAELAAMVRAVRSVAPRTMLVALASDGLDGLDRWWGMVALFTELVRFTELGVVGFPSAPSNAPRSAASAFNALCCATRVSPASRAAWDMVFTDAATSPDRPPPCASTVAVLMDATDEVHAAWASAPSVAWHLRFKSVLVVGLG